MFLLTKKLQDRKNKNIALLGKEKESERLTIYILKRFFFPSTKEKCFKIKLTDVIESMRVKSLSMIWEIILDILQVEAQVRKAFLPFCISGHISFCEHVIFFFLHFTSIQNIKIKIKSFHIFQQVLSSLFVTIYYLLSLLKMNPSGKQVMFC